ADRFDIGHAQRFEGDDVSFVVRFHGKVLTWLEIRLARDPVRADRHLGGRSGFRAILLRAAKPFGTALPREPWHDERRPRRRRSVVAAASGALARTGAFAAAARGLRASGRGPGNPAAGGGPALPAAAGRRPALRAHDLLRLRRHGYHRRDLRAFAAHAV